MNTCEGITTSLNNIIMQEQIKALKTSDESFVKEPVLVRRYFTMNEGYRCEIQ